MNNSPYLDKPLRTEAEAKQLRDAYGNELVTRTAPRWAWDIIDETLACDSNSIAFDSTLRADICTAIETMVEACEKGEE